VHVCEVIDRQFLTWRSRCSSHTCRFRNPASMFRKRIGSAAEEIDVLSAIPPTARNVLKLPSGVILRAIVIEIIFACLPGGACRTFHFINSLSEGTFRTTPFTPPCTFLFHLIGHRFTEENTKRCFALRNGENRIVYSTAIPSVIISLKLFFTHSFTISISFHARLSISSSANKIFVACRIEIFCSFFFKER